MGFQLTLMADIWEILQLYNNYSLATLLYNSVAIQAFQQSIQHLFNGLLPHFSCKTPTRSFKKSSIFPQLFTQYFNIFYGIMPDIFYCIFQATLHSLLWCLIMWCNLDVMYLSCTFSHKETQSKWEKVMFRCSRCFVSLCGKRYMKGTLHPDYITW